MVHFWFIFPEHRIKVPNSCELGPFAGDVHDNGNALDTDACLNNCQPAKCGDKVVQAGKEECDDGNQVDADACSNSCKLPTCSDKVKNAAETDVDCGGPTCDPCVIGKKCGGN
ncbi:MAG TPA: hypothetical protein PL172_12135, partial [Thermomicrobiales bacterium]|nr:hypothetical protein [Thermomicrobiales bacterium]